MNLFGQAYRNLLNDPGHVLLSDADHTYTLADIDEITGRVYRLLKMRGIGRESIAVILLPRCAMTGCVVYTSSSSGRPKGAVHEYGDIDLELEYVFGCMNGAYDFAHERVALAAEVYDIAAITALIEAFYSASYIHVTGRELCRNIKSYSEVIRERKLTTAALMPHLTDLRLLSEIPGIEYLFVGFDVIENVYIPGFPLYNSYGMSESVISAASFLIDRNYDITPVGKPNVFRGTFLADDNDKPVGAGEIGEAVFENPFFRGYLNLPEATALALRNGLYHTGDMGVINSDGNLVILGRKSSIIKTGQGWLIPAVIKAAVNRIREEKIAVMAFAGEERNRVAVYYTGPHKWDADEVNAELKGQLPDYMLPTDYIHLEALPYLTSGKLNRVMLEKIFEKVSRGDGSPDSLRAPSSPFPENNIPAAGT